MELRPRILVVDDDARVRESVVAMLYPEPCDVEFAEDGEQAIARMAGPPCDLVICDVKMPGMDGLEVCRRFKAHPEWRFVPLIMLTALDGQEDMVRGVEAGADEFLTKPVERVVLRMRVRAMLRVRDSFRSLRSAALTLDEMLKQRRERIVREANLSPREQEVLDLLLLGRTHEEIGAALGIAARTAKFHQAHVLEKLGADSRLDLMRIFTS